MHSSAIDRLEVDGGVHLAASPDETPAKHVTCHGGASPNPSSPCRAAAVGPDATLLRRNRERRRRAASGVGFDEWTTKHVTADPLEGAALGQAPPLVDRQAGSLELGEHERAVLAAGDVGARD